METASGRRWQKEERSQKEEKVCLFNVFFFLLIPFPYKNSNSIRLKVGIPKAQRNVCEL
jgi:hypothetical protein